MNYWQALKPKPKKQAPVPTVRPKKPIVRHSITAPIEGESASLETYVKFELAPQYDGLQQYYQNSELHLDIHITDKTVGENYFKNFIDVLRKHCPALVGRYKIIVR